MYKCVGEHVPVYRCMWGPEHDVRYFSQLLSTLVFEAGALNGPMEVLVTGQHIPRILLFLLSHPGISHVCPHAQLFYVGARIESDPHAFTVSTLPTRPSSLEPCSQTSVISCLNAIPADILGTHLALIPIRDWTQVLNLEYSNASDQGAFLIPSDVSSSANRIDY